VRKSLCFCLILILFYSVSWGESLKSRVQKLEYELSGIQQEIEVLKNMAGTIIPADLEIDMDGEDPSDPGDIKVVKGTVLELDDCDATTQWSVHSGAGVTIALDNSTFKEGTGSIKVSVPAGITAIIKATKASGSWDLTSYNYLKVWLRTNTATPAVNCNLHFGESAYGEQNKGAFTLPAGEFSQISWDISAIAAASRNAVTIFAVTLPAVGPTTNYFRIDYAFADPGPSQIKAFDGDRVIDLYPKVYQGTYTGNGSDPQTITLPRKGHPSAIFIQGNAALANGGRPYLWLNTMGDNLAARLDSGGTFDAAMITEVGDCYFKVGDVMNTNTTVFHYLVLWSD
jgi:hypothetical protein